MRSSVSRPISNQEVKSSCRSRSRPRRSASSFRCIEQLGAQIDQELEPVGQRGELLQQPHPRRHQRVPQQLLRRRDLQPDPSPGDRLTIASSTASRSAAKSLARMRQETVAALGRQRHIGAADLRRARARRDLAAAAGDALGDPLAAAARHRHPAGSDESRCRRRPARHAATGRARHRAAARRCDRRTRASRPAPCSVQQSGHRLVAADVQFT